MNQNVNSMTGFSHYQHEHDTGLFIWELRTLNHRYRDLYLQIPSFLREMEIDIRHIVAEKIKRGKIDIYLRFFPNESIKTNVFINTSLVNALNKGILELSSKFNKVDNISMDTLLNWPGLIEYKTESASETKIAVKNSLIKALDLLVLERKKEGQALASFILNATNSLTEELGKLEQLAEEFVKNQPQLIKEKLEALKIDVDLHRFEQEIIFLLQKTDVGEEMTRVKTHINNLEEVISKGGLIGRHLDFILQELNRETNTISSKAQNTGILNHVVNMKVTIEQIREQVQNIE